MSVSALKVQLVNTKMSVSVLSLKVQNVYAKMSVSVLVSVLKVQLV